MRFVHAICLLIGPLLLLPLPASVAWGQTGASSGAAAGTGKLDEGLALFKGRTAVFVRMEDQLFSKGGDYERFCEKQPAACRRLELRDGIVATLRERSKRSFRSMERSLKRLTGRDDVRGVQRYWIVNGFACQATAKGCQALAELPGVGFVYRQRNAKQWRQQDPLASFEPDEKLAKLYAELIESKPRDFDVAFDVEGVEVPWNLTAVGADRAWGPQGVTGKGVTGRGVTGRGVVVAVLDDGMMTVPALLPALWRNSSETLNGKDDDGNGLVDDVFGYDFASGTPYSVSPKGHRHGTLCASVIAARPTPGDASIAAGVAPRARIMPLIGNGQLRAYEYALEQGADVLSMSYTFEPTKMGQYRGLFRTAHEHLSAAGILSVGGAGNYAKTRPIGLQIGSPKDVPCVVAAAGVGPDGAITSFSSLGPVSWEGIRYYDDPDAADLAPPKPDVTACNAGFPMWTLRELWKGAKAERAANVVRSDEEGYALVIGPRGNSFAGPHVAGVAALMLEANPELPVWHLQRLLAETCKDMGEPGHDTAHGAGMLQAAKAVEAARAIAIK